MAVFHHSFASMYYTERKAKNKKQERPGNEANSVELRRAFVHSKFQYSINICIKAHKYSSNVVSQ